MISIFIIALTVTGALVVRNVGLRLGVRHDMQTGAAAALASTTQQPSRATTDR